MQLVQHTFNVNVYKYVFLLLVFQPIYLENAYARRMPGINFRSLSDNSNLVAIGTPLDSTSDTRENSFLLGIYTQNPDGTQQPVAAIGVETTFRILAVLKGDQAITQIVLHHYRMNINSTKIVSGPFLVFFPSNATSKCQNSLLFLIREPDGRYAPTAGQTDPALSSIKCIT